MPDPTLDARIMTALGLPDPTTYVPLRVTAGLQCGAVCDGTLPLDGILHYQHMRQHLGAQQITMPGDVAPSGDVPPMRLAKHHAGQADWYYAASFAQWSTPWTEGTDYWNKRVDQRHADLIDFRGKRGKVLVEQGAYKAYHMPVAYRHALAVTWYLVGDLAWVERLLAMTTHIGKKTDQGWGAVARWEVVPWHADWSVADARGRLMRAVPERGGIRTGIRPSYWLPRNQVPCRMPDEGIDPALDWTT